MVEIIVACSNSSSHDPHFYFGIKQLSDLKYRYLGVLIVNHFLILIINLKGLYKLASYVS